MTAFSNAHDDAQQRKKAKKYVEIGNGTSALSRNLHEETSSFSSTSRGSAKEAQGFRRRQGLGFGRAGLWGRQSRLGLVLFLL